MHVPVINSNSQISNAWHNFYTYLPHLKVGKVMFNLSKSFQDLDFCLLSFIIFGILVSNRHFSFFTSIIKTQLVAFQKIIF